MPRQEASKPNVIYFHVDNLGYASWAATEAVSSEAQIPRGSISSRAKGINS